MKTSQLREVVYVLRKLLDMTGTDEDEWTWQESDDSPLGAAVFNGKTTFTIQPGDSTNLNGYGFLATRRKALLAGGPQFEIEVRSAIDANRKKAAKAAEKGK